MFRYNIIETLLLLLIIGGHFLILSSLFSGLIAALVFNRALKEYQSYTLAIILTTVTGGIASALNQVLVAGIHSPVIFRVACESTIYYGILALLRVGLIVLIYGKQHQKSSLMADISYFTVLHTALYLATAFI